MKEKEEFLEPKDSKTSVSVAFILAGIFFLSYIFLLLTSNYEGNLLNYLGIISAVLMIWAITEKALEGKTGIFQAQWFGNNKLITYGALVGGAIIGLILGLITSAGQYNFILPVQSLTAFSDLNTFLTNVVAPFIEPMGFRGVLFPTFLAFFMLFFGTFTKKFQKPLALGTALLLSAYIFGIYHFNTYLNQTGFQIDLTNTMVFLASFFGLLWIIGGDIILKTISFEIGWHFVNNLFGVGLSIPEVIFFTTIMIAVFIGLFEIVSKFNGGRKK